MAVQNPNRAPVGLIVVTALMLSAAATLTIVADQRPTEPTEPTEPQHAVGVDPSTGIDWTVAPCWMDPANLPPYTVASAACTGK